jgi:hypothetical protein
LIVLIVLVLPNGVAGLFDRAGSSEAKDTNAASEDDQ